MSEGAEETRLRAYRFTLDPTAEQVADLNRHAGASRWAFNHALATKLRADRTRNLQVDELVTLGYTEKQAYKHATTKVPTKPTIQKEWNRLKGDAAQGTDGICAWWREVSTYAFQSAFVDADQAWKNFMDSISGRRAGRRVGKPRFKKKGRSRDSFRLYGSSIRLQTYRRLNVPRIGSLRLHDSGKRLARTLERGAVIQNVTISRGGSRWYASVLVAEPAPRVEPTRAQVKAGKVGINWGVHHLGALSTGELIDNPHHANRANKKIVKAQKALSRTEKGSRRRAKAINRLSKAHHQVAEQRKAHLHQVTKRLATGFETVAIQDLDVQAMTASARGTVEKPGRHVKQKAQLNRAVLDVSFGELRRQLEYKTQWYGSQLAISDRFEPVDQICSACGATKPKLPLSKRVFSCDCGASLDRDLNAAHNIAATSAVPVAQDNGET